MSPPFFQSSRIEWNNFHQSASPPIPLGLQKTQPPLFYPHCHCSSSDLHLLIYYSNFPTTYLFYLNHLTENTCPIPSKYFFASHVQVQNAYFSRLSITKLYPSFSSHLPHVHFRHSLIQPRHPPFHVSAHVIPSAVFFLYLSIPQLSIKIHLWQTTVRLIKYFWLYSC